MMQNIDFILAVVVYLLKMALLMSTPLVLAAIGGMFSEKSGVVNIGLEGMMLMGAFMAVIGSYLTGNPWVGVLFAVISGGALATVHAMVCVRLRGNQIVSGTGIILLASGTTVVGLTAIWGPRGVSDQVASLQPVTLPFLSGVPILGDVFGSLSPLVYIMFIVVIVSHYVVYHTPFGLRLRAAGEDPSTLSAAGVNVETIRIIGVVMSGCLAGLGGAFLSISYNNFFGKNMTSGRGFIALAALIFGNWTPIGCLLSGLLFGLLIGLQFVIVSIPQLSWLQSYQNFVQMTPYILVILALAGIRRSIPPKAIGVPYERESRA